ncbi:adenosylmethionine--8-amino-7-oxononanoate transaminase [Deltaproteobacteria bacterium TL4]
MKKAGIWYPYAQMKNLELNYKVESAKGVYLQLSNGQRLIDAISSWWAVIHGYGHPELDQAVTEQLKRVAHVMLGGLVNEPAERLAQKLVEITPPGLNHVFFGDSGSVGVEIALKMAVQYWFNQGVPQKSRMVALRKAYHGDTTGCMSVCDPEDGMHALFQDILRKQFFVDAPNCAPDGKTDDVEADVRKLESLFQAHHQEIAGFILEPLLQAAGGFNMYSPVYLKKVRALCDKYQILLLCDEVATGFGRTGSLFASNQADITPDIMILGKGLTAGYMGHSATLATDKIFEAFYSDRPEHAFMHGPTFMGNPLACAIALKSIEVFQREDYLKKIKVIENILKTHLLSFHSEKVKAIRVLGATGVIEFFHKKDLKGAQDFAAKQGVWLRPFNTYLYTMPPYIISEEELLKVIEVMKLWVLTQY